MATSKTEDTPDPHEDMVSKDPGDTNFQGFSTVDGVVQTEGGDKAADPKAADPKAADPKVADPKAAPEVGKDEDTAIEDGEVLDDNDPQDTPKSRSAQARINQAIGRQRAAERQNGVLEGKLDALSARIEALSAKDTPEDAVDPTAPRSDTYEYGELDPKFIGDLARHEARKEFAAQQVLADKARDDREAAAQADNATQQISEFSTKWQGEYADFDQVVVKSAENSEWPLSQTVGALALGSPVGGHVLYSLAKDAREAQRVASLPDIQQAAWFGAAAAKYSPTTPGATPSTANGAHEGQRVTSAPEPLQYSSKGSGNPNSVASDTNDFTAFEALAAKK